MSADQLRDLAERLREVTRHHAANSQVYRIVENACDHIDALAAQQELNIKLAESASADGNK